MYTVWEWSGKYVAEPGGPVRRSAEPISHKTEIDVFVDQAQQMIFWYVILKSIAWECRR
jgi:hypothetical protein